MATNQRESVRVRGQGQSGLESDIERVKENLERSLLQGRPARLPATLLLLGLMGLEVSQDLPWAGQEGFGAAVHLGASGALPASTN